MELPRAQICPQGNRQDPSPTFSTFLPTGLSHRNSQGLDILLQPRSHILVAEEMQPRALPMKVLGTLQAQGATSSPEDAGKSEEEVPGEGGLNLQAETRVWFQKTQAHCILQHGAAPAWFHGFITRREAEKLLETKPRGCYLVRFSESAVTFVLTYRSQTCCRHFLLAQLGDGRHVVLGEDSAHMRLQDLLRHYTACPLSPYGEKLTEPCARQTPEPAGLSLKTEERDPESKTQDLHLQYSAIRKQGQAAAPLHKEPAQPPRPNKRPVPAKPQLFLEVCASSAPGPRPAPPPPPKPSNAIYHEPDEPIAFYAMGRGSPGEAPSNIYAEVEVAPEREEACSTWRHQVLRKCRSRPVLRSQNPGGPQLHSENSLAGQGPALSHQPQPPRGYTLPPNFSRQVLQEQEQAWLPLGPPQ